MALQKNKTCYQEKVTPAGRHKKVEFKFLYNPKIKKILWGLLGPALYLKMVSLPNSSAAILLYKWIFSLGLVYPYRSVPISVAIETNAYCNRKCPYCPNSKYNLRSNIDMKMNEGLFYKIINELAGLNYYRNVYFNIYNEPLTDKRLPMFIGYTRSKLPKTTIEVYTNGDYLDYSSYCLLLKNGVDRFIISIHGEKPSAKLSETLKRLSEKEKTSNLILKDVYDDFGNKRDVFFNRGGAININERSADQKPCPYVLVCNINFQGNVILCCNDYFGKHVFGNVNNQSLHDIWFDKNYMLLRNRIALGYRELSLCKKCNI